MAPTYATCALFLTDSEGLCKYWNCQLQDAPPDTVRDLATSGGLRGGMWGALGPTQDAGNFFEKLVVNQSTILNEIRELPFIILIIFYNL